MIKLNNINKTYNKGKRNEVQAIKNISLEFPNTGLVCLLGQSGSGKSTLLNTISGLDSVDNGQITILDTDISKYNANKWDEIRFNHFGYIFQNYLLFPELTVYENVKFAIKLTDLSDEEIDYRINYALEAVRMDKFKRRKARNLSGGQQQRVAIARALVSSPSIIIADEPTGNLDATNSRQIINIIKSISKNCLVVLVTHNNELANFYADRIIKISDGEIIDDYLNHSNALLTHKDDQNIYLQDYTKETIDHDSINLDYFYHDYQPKLNLNVVFKDNTFYIAAESDKAKIKFLTPEDEVKLVDSQKEIEYQTIEEEEYFLSPIPPISKNNKTMVPFFEIFKTSFKKLFSAKKGRKVLLFVFMLSAILIVINLGQLIGNLNVDISKQVSTDTRALLIGRDQIKGPQLEIDRAYQVIDGLIASKDKLGYFDISNSYSGINTYIDYNMFYQVQIDYNFKPFLNIPGSIISNSILKERDIIYGKLPSKYNEIIVDKTVINDLLKIPSFYQSGFMEYRDFLNQNVFMGSLPAVIVGISDTNNKSIYTNEQYRNIAVVYDNGFIDQDFKELYSTNYQQPLKVREILIEASELERIGNKEQLENGGIEIIIDGIKYTIVGTFTNKILLEDDKANYRYVANSDDIKRSYLYNSYNQNGIIIYSTNKEQTAKILKDDYNLESQDIYQENLDYYKEINKKNLTSKIITTSVILAITLIFIYFIIRTSLTERIYEIGVYRALGVFKKDIYKIFAIEVFTLTLFTSFIGWSIISYILLVNFKDVEINRFYYNLPFGLMILLGIFLVNIIVGLIPVAGLLRKTPAEINKQYDI